MHGDHTDDVSVSTQKLIIDLHGAKKIGSAKLVEKSLADALEFSKNKAVTIDVRGPDARGWVSAVASLKVGQVKIDACPATGFVAVDITGAAGLRPEAVMFGFAEAFGAREVMIKKSRSGSELARIKPVVAISATPRPVRKSTAKAVRKAA